MNDLRELKKPESLESLSLARVTNGPLLSPQQILATYSSEQYEDFIEEWASEFLGSRYIKIRRSGGAGDMGRDVIAYIKEPESWDNYQCKHYGNPLSPSKVWEEVGKVFFHASKGEFTLPAKYYFVAQNGVGPKLRKLLDNPDEFKKELKINWNQYCLDKISESSQVILEGALEQLINETDFAMFGDVSPREIINQFKSSARYTTRFGGGLPERVKNKAPSLESETIQLFIARLLEAYSEHSGKSIVSLEDVANDTIYLEHLKQQRECFYSAESLKAFARDSLPSESTVFSDFQDDIFHGIIDELNLSNLDGYTNVQMATSTASKLPLLSGALRDYITIIDKKGACHQLANDGRVKWSKNV